MLLAHPSCPIDTILLVNFVKKVQMHSETKYLYGYIELKCLSKLIGIIGIKNKSLWDVATIF